MCRSLRPLPMVWTWAPGADHDVGDGEPGQLGDPQPGLDGKHEHGVVASAGPRCPVAGSEQRVDLGVGEVGDEVALETLAGDGQHPLDRRGVLGMAQGGVAEQGVDGGKPMVAGAHAVVAVAFEVLQERRDKRGVEVAEVEVAWLCAGPLGGEGEQQPERVAVSGDRVRAGPALADQPLGEEGLQGGRERGHGRARNGLWSRAAASSINSGEADRYQYVPDGLTCPR